jgi:hypothetical protein
MREAAREVLRELLPGMLDDILGAPHATGQATSNGQGRGRAGSDGRGGRSPATGSGRADEAAAADVVPLVPAPPVAAVLRPSTWSAPAVPGELVGERPPAGSAPAVPGELVAERPPAGSARVEPITIDGDEDLERFVRALLARFENPRDRRAIRSGRLRFVLRPSSTARATPAAANAAPVMRMEKGAVTERTVRAAAADGARLLLARGAVLTPLARDQARALHVEIERER